MLRKKFVPSIGLTCPPSSNLVGSVTGSDAPAALSVPLAI